MAFDPTKYIIQIKGKDYLQTKHRLMWFREDHPAGGVSSEQISDNPPVFKAYVYNDDGRLLSTGHATAIEKGGEVWKGRAIEKAETAAIGRALGHAGYGTQFAVEGEPEDDSEMNHLADSPDNRHAAPKNPPKPAAPKQTPLESPVPTFDKTTGRAFLDWLNKELVIEDDAIADALNKAAGGQVPVIQAWPYGVPETIGAVLAYHCGYEAERINAFIDNAKRTGTFKNSAKVAFTPAYLENYRTLAMKLVKE